MKFLNYVSKIALVIVFAFIALAACAPVGTDSPWDMDAISQALQNLALLVIPALGAFIARWLNAKYQSERANLSELHREYLDIFIRTMVYAAEQLKFNNKIDDKLDYVEMMVDGWLTARGIDMDWEEIRARIEAAVKESFPKPPAEG
jgi:hypothetical protein